MESLRNFFNFNKTCPICDKELELYLQLDDSICFKAEKYDDGNIFTPFMCKKVDLNEEYIYVSNVGDQISFSSYCLSNEVKSKQMYFFYLCNADGFESRKRYSYSDLDSKEDYELNVYKSCYWRATPHLDLYLDNDNWDLKVTNPDNINIVNDNEIFCFKKKLVDVEKVYILNLNSSENVTGFVSYSVTESQLKDFNFNPNLFDKSMPLLSIRPDFSINNRDKLINRFESWIIMS